MSGDFGELHRLDQVGHSEDALPRARDAEHADREAEFGPSGYLPGRAAKRARKIVLRAPLGMAWIVAAALLGAVVLVAGWVFLSGASAPPAAPFVAVGAPPGLDEAEVLEDLDVLVVSAGRVRAFAGAEELGLSYCARRGHIEGSQGRTWSLTGRGFGGVASLEEHPTVIHGDVLYLDPTRTLAAPPPLDEPAPPSCPAPDG